MDQLVCEPVKEENLSYICKSANLDEELNSIRLLNDFKNSNFYGILSKYEKNSNEILGYILYYYAYSTWESRVLYISHINLPLSDTNLKSLVFQNLCFKLIQIARDMKCSRINYNLNIFQDPGLEMLFVEKIEAFNLTKLENWTFFRMDSEVLRKFADVGRNKDEITNSKTNIKIRKINIDTDCDKIRQLIYELAVFEKLEDQFRTKTEELVRDYQENNSFYDCFVAENSKTNEIVSFALYYYNYSLQNGRGCYLEDLYVKPEWRNFGIGTLLWRKVAFDCLNNSATYLEWNCLDWNTSAIEFYLKNGAYNSSKVDNTHYIRIRRERIYKEVI
jgi:GNAT superfamily N-acetyltransferase